MHRFSRTSSTATSSFRSLRLPTTAILQTPGSSQHACCRGVVATPLRLRLTQNSSFSTSIRLSKSLDTTPNSTAPVPALILKPYLNFKALSHSETATAAMAKNIRDRNLPASISVASVNELYATVAERTQRLDRARAERNRTAAEMKTLFSSGGAGAGKGGKKGGKKVSETVTGAGVSGSGTGTMELTELSKEAKETKRQELVERGRVLKEEIHAQEAELFGLETQLYEQAVMIPNTTHPESPIGPESEARLVRIHGVPRLNPGVKAFAQPGVVSTTTVTSDILDVGSLGGEEGGALLGNVSKYPLLDHVALAKHLDLVDFESATAVTGSRWYYLKNEAALLELALIQFATQRAVKAGFMPVITPDVVRPEVVQACGFQPRDEASQTYWVSTVAPGSAKATATTPEGGAQHHHQHSALCLVATAEIALAGMNLNKVIEESQLPIKMAGFGRAFRAEAGSRGAEVKGLYRVHQFSKVELFVLSKADSGESDRILEDIRRFQEDIFEELGLCYRYGTGYADGRTGSERVQEWMPGRNGWGEISSTSNCTDYQARRLNIRYRTNKVRQLQPQQEASSATGAAASNSVVSTEFVHTLNGTAMAIPRIIVALLETYQQPDGSVRLPECLWPFMAGIKEIHPK
ncbi:seryl-tRNA synthetase [Linnemannia gamsii]|uniref:serine--tRNA ligase n=1 Tax=Linnemannia gamsii TaxID=64522 RepID=A0ABQ7KD61_9FUNG|nr:seryl-tRNA synthetase [Linnemannia gamsii]